MGARRVTRKARRFGAVLRAARKRRGWSQAELALKLRRSGSNISNYENGKTIPRLDTLLLLAEPLDLEVLTPKALLQDATKST